MGRESRSYRKRDPFWTGAVLSAFALFILIWLFSSLGPFLSWILSMTIVTTAIYVLDKLSARSKGRRAPEPLLMTCAIIGGGIGAFLSMVILPHKKNKGSFWAVNLFSGIMWGLLLVWDFIS
jgi:uncharacterized membrane protein YsdA (DUF1294 family)